MTVQFCFFRKVDYKWWHKLLSPSVEETANSRGASMCSLLHSLFSDWQKKIYSTHVGLPGFFNTVSFPWNQWHHPQADSFRVPALNSMTGWVGSVEEVKGFVERSGGSLDLFQADIAKSSTVMCPQTKCWIRVEKMLRDRNWRDKHKCQDWFKSRHCHRVRQKFKERKTWSKKCAKKSREKAREVFKRCCMFA